MNIILFLTLLRLQPYRACSSVVERVGYHYLTRVDVITNFCSVALHKVSFTNAKGPGFDHQPVHVLGPATVPTLHLDYFTECH